MRYALDTEFIDTPTCSALISLALVGEDGASQYFEFEYPEAEITPWLRTNVVAGLLKQPPVSFKEAADHLRGWIGRDKPEFWAYYGSYDFYWLSRLFGGLINTPAPWPNLFHEFALVGKPRGGNHNALQDAHALMNAIRRRVA